MAQFAFYLVPVASSSFTIAVRTLPLLPLSLLVLAGVSSYRCACRQPLIPTQGELVFLQGVDSRVGTRVGRAGNRVESDGP